MRIQIWDPGIFLTLDLGWKKFGFGINIPDPHHCFFPKIIYRYHTSYKKYFDVCRQKLNREEEKIYSFRESLQC